MTMIWCGLQRGVKIGGGRGDTEGDQTQINKHTHTHRKKSKKEEVRSMLSLMTFSYQRFVSSPNGKSCQTPTPVMPV